MISWLYSSEEERLSEEQKVVSSKLTIAITFASAWREDIRI
jgi:hypothetical protein